MEKLEALYEQPKAEVGKPEKGIKVLLKDESSDSDSSEEEVDDADEDWERIRTGLTPPSKALSFVAGPPVVASQAPHSLGGGGKDRSQAEKAS